MPFSGGTYAGLSNSFNDAASGTKIDPLDWNALFTDIETALNEVRGQSTALTASSITLTGGELVISFAGTTLAATNTTDSTSKSVAQFSSSNATRANNDDFYISYFLSNSAGTQKEFGRTFYRAKVVTSTSEDGELGFSVMAAGTITAKMLLDKTRLAPNTSDGIALGSTSLMWSDLFLASGSVINFNNDVTLTHSSNALNVDGGNVLWTSDNTFDIGASGATRPRNGYFAGSLFLGDQGSNTNTTVLFQENGNILGYIGRISSTFGFFDGGGGAVLLMGGLGTAGTWNSLVQFGGATSSFPAIKRSSATLQARLADDSAYTSIAASRLITPLTSGLTIASGVITVTAGYHTVDTESAAASDDLDTINGGTDGAILVLRAVNSAHTVVVKDGIGNIQCAGDFSLDNEQDTITLIFDNALSAWLELHRSDNGA